MVIKELKELCLISLCKNIDKLINMLKCFTFNLPFKLNEQIYDYSRKYGKPFSKDYLNLIFQKTIKINKFSITNQELYHTNNFEFLLNYEIKDLTIKGIFNDFKLFLPNTIENINIFNCNFNTIYINIGKILEKCNNLHKICIIDNHNIGNEFKYLLKGLTSSKDNLIDLKFENCSLTEQQCCLLGEFLHECSILKYINLDKNKFTDKGFYELCRGLENLKNSLTHISLRDCSLTEHQGSCLAKLFKVCNFLEEIDLNSNSDLDNSITEIFFTLISSGRTLRKIFFDSNDISGVKCLHLINLIENCHSIETIWIPCYSGLEKGLKKICKSSYKCFTTLREIYFTQISPTEKVLDFLYQFLEKCQSLTKIHLIFTEPPKNQEKIFKALKFSNQSLKEINPELLSFNKISFNSFIALVQNCSSLEKFNINGSAMTNEEFTMLIDCLKSSKNCLLDLNVFTLKTGNQFHQLMELLKLCTKLKKFSISLNIKNYCFKIYCHFIENYSKFLNLINILNISFENEDILDFKILYEYCSAFKKIFIYSLYFVFEIQLSDDQSSLQSIEEIIIESFNDVGILKCMIEKSEYLKKITLNCLTLEENDLKTIAENLGSSKEYLEELSLIDCCLNCDDNNYISSLIESCYWLKKINLSRNTFNDTESILKAFKSSSYALNELYLSECSLPEASSVILGNTLSNCTVLTSIDLSSNNSMRNGFKNICNGLKNSVKSLRNIDVSRCRLNNEDIRSLGDLFIECDSLQKVNLSHNLQVGVKLNIILHGLRSSANSLTYFDLKQCYLSNEQYGYFVKFINEFPNMKHCSRRFNRDSCNVLEMFRRLQED